MPDPMRPSLFYKRTCPPCRWMSRLVVLFSLGVIERRPIDSEEARELYRHHPGHEGQLVLVDGAATVFGRKVFTAIPATILRSAVRRLVLRAPGARRS